MGLQTLFEESEECPGVAGLGVIPGKVEKFEESASLSKQLCLNRIYPENRHTEAGIGVPHIGWNGLEQMKPSRLFASKWTPDLRVYFVHSFCARANAANEEWVLSKTRYGSDFISAVQKGNVIATQFHPEKSGPLGLTLFKAFLSSSTDPDTFEKPAGKMAGLSKRVIACLDVRRDENEELVVTKGISYDVMENGSTDGEAASVSKVSLYKTLRCIDRFLPCQPQKRMRVRNLGDPVEMSDEYSAAGCDELTFLSIKSYDTNTILDTPLHKLLERTSEKVFVPLTIGGGIRDYVGKDGVNVSALEVASKYFRSGADKVSIGSDAVRSVQKLKARGGVPDGTSPIETISHAYGKQAVVISVDPKRVYVTTPEACEEATKAGHTVITLPDGSKCWYAATTSGGKKVTDLDAVELVKGCEKLGAGEILLNCIDTDGKNQGFDLALTNAVCEATTLPVIGELNSV